MLFKLFRESETERISNNFSPQTCVSPPLQQGATEHPADTAVTGEEDRPRSES